MRQERVLDVLIALNRVIKELYHKKLLEFMKVVREYMKKINYTSQKCESSIQEQIKLYIF